MDEHRHRLRQLTEDLLFLDHPGRLRTAAIELHALCWRIAGLQENSSEEADNQRTLLPEGLALDPISAALCILQYPRTAKFMRGVCRAVEVARERFPSECIEILYAGCGPFAPLAIPLMTQFDAEKVQFTLLDIHQRSLDCAHRIVGALGFGAHVREYVCADATAYLHPGEHPLTIVISETMQRALMIEPQVAVTLNLVPQLRPGGIFIPESISVDACLFDPGSEFQSVTEDIPGGSTPARERLRIPLASLLELDAASVPQLKNCGFPAVRVPLPPPAEPQLRLMLRTKVTVFGPEILGDYDSGITCPFLNKDLDVLQPGSEAVFRYETGSVPGFRFTCHQSHP